MRRVAITGVGTMNALGNDAETSFRRMLGGENGIETITSWDTSEYPVHFAANVKCDLGEHFSKPDHRKLDPFVMYALLSTREALRDAGLEDVASDSPEQRERYGCIIGTGIGGLQGIEQQFLTLMEKGPRRVSPHFIPRIMANAITGQVAIAHGLLGTSFTTISACASAGHAMGMALHAIQLGEADLVVTGGAESANTPLGLSGFSAAKALSTRNEAPHEASRPFDRDRDGFVMGEGSGVLIFEEMERARARGARIYAEVKGYGSTDDAFHMTAPREDGDGAARAFSLALERAGVAPEQVDYINAHGTSTKYNDVMETVALKRVFGDHARKLAISSTKSMVGHLLGASAAVEMVATVLSIHKGVAHPTRNLVNPDPECDLDYIPGSAREMKIRNALSNSLGFGGHNVSICIGQPDE